ncbi:MAG: hemolysin, partial [Candidatus Competibacteraceae bacterium]|nr:hemolysin [Candidatus Competibacteraceae bacterium]
ELRVNPLLPLPEASLPVDMPKVSLPPLLKAYLRVGAKICGPPCLDADFQVADFFIMVDTKGLDRRYARHFLS